jgi:ATP-dependent Clp protease ATP-binding subunit ClpA
MDIETREIELGNRKELVEIKKFCSSEMVDRLMKMPLNDFVYETSYIFSIIDMCWLPRGDIRIRSLADRTNLYRAILEVNPKLDYENCKIELPIVTKKRVDKPLEYQPKPKEEVSQGVSLEEIVSIVDFEELESSLNREVIGQGEAIRQLLSAVINVKHMGTLKTGCSVDYLLGPSGVGKTSSVRGLAEFLDAPLLLIQGSEYEEKGDATKLFGAGPSYVGYDETGGHLQRFVKKNPNSIILIDEIDKFHPECISSLTSFFGDGFLSVPSSEERLPFNGLIYLTSNTGNKLSEASMGRVVGFADNEHKSDSEIEKERILKILREQGIGSEFLGRVNNFITFKHLSNSDIERILNKNIKEFNEKLKYYNFSLTDSAKKGLLKVCDTDSFGAREIQHVLGREISKMNYEYEMDKSIPQSSMISVDFKDGKFTYSIIGNAAVKTNAV